MLTYPFGRLYIEENMADPWQECMDYAVTLAKKAGEVSINHL